MSASRVKRGSVRADTARPPTNANREWVSARSRHICRSAASSAVTPIGCSRQPDALDHRRIPHRAGRAATRGEAGRSRLPLPADDGVGDSGASRRRPPGTGPALRGTTRSLGTMLNPSWNAAGSPALTQLVWNCGGRTHMAGGGQCRHLDEDEPPFFNTGLQRAHADTVRPAGCPRQAVSTAPPWPESHG